MSPAIDVHQSIKRGNASLVFNGNYGSDFVDTDGYFAFTFSGGQLFGWARVSTLDPDGTDDLNEFVLEEYAFTTKADHTINIGEIGAVPEPTSLGLLALGAIGVLSSRRRKLVA